MKKFLSILLALALVLSLGTVAFAAGGEPSTTYEDQGTVTLKKIYKLENESTTSPAETFTFSAVTCDAVEGVGNDVTKENAPLPTVSPVQFEEGTATTEGKEGTFTITLPEISEYKSVGVYTYSFTENTGTTAGVEYSTQKIELKVYVLNDGNGSYIRVPSIVTKVGDKKLESIENTYSAGSLAVTKSVTGNLGDKQKDFNVTVTFTKPEGKTVNSTISYTDETDTETILPTEWSGNTATANITLKDGETVTFTNIPYEVTYTVVEEDYTGEGYLAAQYDDNANGTINAAAISTTITNDKNVEGVIDTGVFMDSLPYVLLLVGACAGLVVFFARRRMTHKG